MLLSSRRLPLFVALLGSGAVALAAISARSQTPSGPAAASGYPSAHASAAPAAPSSSGSTSAWADASLPAPSAADIPAEPSEPVKDAKEWDGAKRVRPAREPKVPCTFRILRDWLRIECEHRAGAGLVAGDPKDVKIWASGDVMAESPGLDDKNRPPPTKAFIQMRLRRGDTKIFQLAQVDFGWDWVGVVGAENFTVMWREGKDPVILFP
jgi:hypothetical protein